jgi:BlaI family penicillinase repressor
MAGSGLRLGKVQLEIMQVLWRRGRATAREITDDLSASKPIAHSTVQTLLRKMEAKGAVAHEIEERTFVFVPLHEENEVTAGATRDLLARLFGNSVPELVAHLLQHERIAPHEMEQIKKMIEEADSK